MASSLPRRSRGSYTIFLKSTAGTRTSQVGLVFESGALCYAGGVNTHEIVASLDIEITRLQRARTLIANSAVPQRRDRPTASAKAAPMKRVISAEGRKRIAEAQRKRWAAQKKQESVKVTRVAAKEAPKRRSPKPAARSKNALSGSVFGTPVAASAKSVAVRDAKK